MELYCFASIFFYEFIVPSDNTIIVDKSMGYNTTLG